MKNNNAYHHYNVKENAELVAKILDADACGKIYGETGLTPDEIKAYIDAYEDYRELKEQGRLIVLPLGKTVADITKLIEEKEIYTADKATAAKADWQRLVADEHENSYAASAVYETWREAATLFADLGTEVENAILQRD